MACKHSKKYINPFCMKIGGHGSLIACVAPGISIQSLTQSLFLTPTFRDTQLLYKSNKNLQ